MNRKYRSTVIAANWKMNMTPSEIRPYAEQLKQILTPAKWCDIIICPSFPLIPAVQKALRDVRIAVGAQNVSEHESGAYTGEVSAQQLSELGLHYVIVGHSERRALFGEDDLTVNKKVLAALGMNIRPIVCVGETLDQREAGVAADVVTLQLKTALSGVPAAKMRRVIVAYEPIWAIGTGKTASTEDAEEIAKTIRAIIRTLYGARTARAVSILYGGSMHDSNAADLLAQPDIDGGLIGTASLSPTEFAAIIEAARPAESNA